MNTMSKDDRIFHFRGTTWFDRIVDRMRFSSCYRNARLIPALNQTQHDYVAKLRRDGFVQLDRHIPPERLGRMQRQFDATLRALRFEMPCLAQSRVDPVRDADLISNFMYATPQQLAARGLAFDKSDCGDYEQVLRDFNPSTLTAYMLAESEDYRAVWLDPFVLSIVTQYLGMVPRLAEAYVRRNYPSPYRTMNHFWHRDLNHKHFLLKAFIFLTDCTVDNGPHEFIRGSQRSFEHLNDKRYFDDAEVDAVYPVGSSDRIVSEVAAGTVILEDTRGAHRARMPNSGFRDLGYAVFMPLPADIREAYYAFPQEHYQALTPFQRAFIPVHNVR